MKVLYILAHCPQNSESYADAEISYLLGKGIKIEIWSPVRGYGDEPQVRVHRGTLQAAIREFLPDVIHIHHMTTALQHIDGCPRDRVTVRAHSFDWTLTRVNQLVVHPAVRRVFAFPHLARQVPGVVPLPVAYDPGWYYRFDDKDTHSVVRLAAGLPTKRLEDFITVGNMLGHDARFTLAVTTAIGLEGFVDQLKKINKSLGGKVLIKTNLSRVEASDLVRRAAVYMSTYNEKAHPFGMPISMVEAMATGAVVLARSTGDASVSEFMGPARLLYSTPEEAAAIIETVLEFGPDERRVAADVSCESAARFRSDVVLPRLIEEWNRICLDHF